jgi:hypothetical protein
MTSGRELSKFNNFYSKFNKIYTAMEVVYEQNK